MAPHWEKVATSLKGKVKVAKVDCAKHPEFCKERDITSFPTARLYTKQNKARWGETYNEPRKFSFIKEWALSAMPGYVKPEWDMWADDEDEEIENDDDDEDDEYDSEQWVQAEEAKEGPGK